MPAGGMGAPPPLPAQAMFHVEINGQPSGPYNLQQIQQGIAQGQMNAQTLVWSQGMTGWQAAGTVPALAQLFQAPPPMPGAAAPPPVPPQDQPPAAPPAAPPAS
jgi:hypothetical protein